MLGIFARVWLYLQNGELLRDEAYLSASIYHSSFRDILSGNLPYGQVAPLGFILSVKLLSFLFGYSEHILRLIPFVSGLLLLPVAYSFAKKEFGAKTAGIFLFFLSISDTLLFYTVQFKQYETEALISLIYLNFYCINREKITEGKIPLKFVFIAMFLTLFGNSPIFVLCGIFSAMLYEQLKNKNLFLFLKNNCVKIFAVILFCLAYYYFYLNRINSVSSNFMHSFWSRYYLEGEWEFFQKISLYLQYYAMPLIGQYFTVISSITEVNAIFFIGCFCGGSFFLFREKKHIFFATIITLCILLFLHITRFYPLGYPLYKKEMANYVAGIRLSLYFIPISLIPVSFCLGKLYKRLSRRSVTILTFCIMASFAVYANEWRINEGIRGYEIKLLLEMMNRFGNENSIIFLNKGAEATYLYNQHKNEKSREYYILEDESLPLPAGIDGNKKEVLTIKNVNSIPKIFEIARNMQKRYAIVLFVYSDPIAIKQAKEILKFIQINYRLKSSASNSSRYNDVILMFVDLE